MHSFHDRASILGAVSLYSLLVDRIARLEADGLLDLTHFLVIEPGDTEADIIGEICLSPLVNPLDGVRYGSPDFHPFWDWLQSHRGWFELIVCVGDSGFAFVLFIQDHPDTDPQLLSLCRGVGA